MLESPEFWVAVSFVLFLVVVGKKAMSALGGMLDDRTEQIRKQLDEAQNLREEAQAELANYQRLQRDALAEAEEIISHAKEEAARIREEAKTDLAERLKRREEQAMDRIAQAEAQALQDVRAQAVDLAIAATAKLLEDNVDDGVRERLVTDAVESLPTRLQ